MFTHIFVYGTLKSGQVRESCWPAKPSRVCNAWTLGKLFDIGPYPALAKGQDRVAGELWTFPSEVAPNVFDVLDEIEGTNQPGVPNEYDRVIQTVHRLNGDACQASLYRFSTPERLKQTMYVRPSREIDGHKYAAWPPAPEA